MTRQNVNLKFGVAGKFKFEITKADADGNPILGSTREVAAFPNLITDAGMDSIAHTGSSSADHAWNTVAVGSGTKAPDPLDTGLQTEVARTSTLFNPGSPVGNSYGITRQVATSPRWWRLWKKWRFNTGAAAGNLNEVAVLRGIGTPQWSFCRARIVGADGEPITLTVLQDEILDITYEFYVYIPENDVTGSIELKGDPYTFTMRPCSIGRESDGYATGWPVRGLSSLQQEGPRAVGSIPFNTSGTCAAVAAGASLVSIDQHPIVSQDPNPRGADSVIYGSYTPGQFYLDSTFKWSLTTVNHSALNILTLNNGLGTFQIYFDGATFSKSSAERMEFTLRTTWERATPP